MSVNIFTGTHFYCAVREDTLQRNIWGVKTELRRGKCHLNEVLRNRRSGVLELVHELIVHLSTSNKFYIS